jgi:hypothetical protein
MAPATIGQYGVPGAYAGTLSTSDSASIGTVIPVTLADGRRAQLFVAGTAGVQPQASPAIPVTYTPGNTFYPAQIGDGVNRPALVQTQTVAAPRRDRPAVRKRSWQKEAIIIGGSAGAGTLIGALAGGKKGAGIGAAVGGVGGLVYDLATRNNVHR